MKPLVRWTIGSASDTGIEILSMAVPLFAKIYPEFKRIICFNNIKLSKIKHLNKYSELFEQKENDSIFKIIPENLEDDSKSYGCGWKLCPPRIRPESHELFIDNDLIITKRIKELDNWLLTTDETIITEGHPRSRMFGVFDECIPSGIHACAGFFGIPPNFDFSEKIKMYITKKNTEIGGWDEQGLTTAIITNEKHKIIPLSKIHISEDWVPNPLAPLLATKETDFCGFHFVGANKKPWHRGWALYKATIKKLFI